MALRMGFELDRDVQDDGLSEADRANGAIRLMNNGVARMLRDDGRSIAGAIVMGELMQRCVQGGKYATRTARGGRSVFAVRAEHDEHDVCR